MPKSKNVTVAIPVYGDWPSLSDCIESLKLHVGADNKVILLNDCGPDADEIEQGIKKAIKGLENFEYHRNPANLGFVKTCNRLTLEIDKSGNDILLLNSDTIVTKGAISEMSEVLHASSKHGCVSPRSNNATICSVPFVHRSNFAIRDDLGYSMRIYQKLIRQLSRFTLAPVAHGYCMLIRRKLIDEFGLFDEVYGLGYGEESDFCMRIGSNGYLSVLANRAYVAHMESRSFTSDKKLALMQRNEQVLLSRYPYHNDLIYKYNNYEVDAVDWFADILFGPLEPAKLLIYVSPKVPQSGANNLIKSLVVLSEKNIEICITSIKNKALSRFKNTSFKLVNAYDLNELFHVGYAPFFDVSLKDLAVLNKRCVRVVARAEDSNIQHYIFALDKSADLIERLGNEVKSAKKTNLKQLRQRWVHFNEQAEKIESKKSFSKALKLKAKNKLHNQPKLYNATRSAYRRIRR